MIALALIVKALVPAGWMPVFEDGEVTLRLCGGWTRAPLGQPPERAHHGAGMEHRASAPSVPHGQHEEEQKNSDQPCSFAAAGLSWTSSDPAGSAQPPLQSGATARHFPPAVAIGRGLAAPPPPSTGPPILT